MKKSILTAALIASFSGAVSAQGAESPQPLTDTITWKGKVPAIVVGNNSMVIKPLTGSLDDAQLVFYRDANGKLAVKPTAVESFEVVNKEGTPVQHKVTLSDVTATYNSSGESHQLSAGSVKVKRNDVAMTVGTVGNSGVTTSRFTLDITEAGITELEKQENAMVTVIATVVVTSGATF